MNSIKKFSPIALFIFLTVLSISAQESAVTVNEDGIMEAKVSLTVAGVEHAFVPRGAILMWSGSIDEIPEGWVLCDGGSYTVTQEDGSEGSFTAPDLRSRFIVGAGEADTIVGEDLSTYPVGATDVNGPGEEKHTLSIEEMPEHDHLEDDEDGEPIPVETSEDGRHRHSMNMMHSHSGSTKHSTVEWEESSGTKSTDYAGEHTHSVTIPKEGGSQAHENRPPYYALAFILKT